jgi:hypothetical protein
LGQLKVHWPAGVVLNTLVRLAQTADSGFRVALINPKQLKLCLYLAERKSSPELLDPVVEIH